MIMKTVLLAALLIGTATAAHATGPDGCLVVSKTPDGFLNVRKAPTMKSKIIAKIHPADVVYTSHDQARYP
jgi:hypothetical protein